MPRRAKNKSSTQSSRRLTEVTEKAKSTAPHSSLLLCGLREASVNSVLRSLVASTGRAAVEDTEFSNPCLRAPSPGPRARPPRPRRRFPLSAFRLGADELCGQAKRGAVDCWTKRVGQIDSARRGERPADAVLRQCVARRRGHPPPLAG